jgi:hypothetical protein
VAEAYDELVQQGFHRQWGEQVVPKSQDDIKNLIPYYLHRQTQLA